MNDLVRQTGFLRARTARILTTFRTNETWKRIVKNLFALTALQYAAYIFPLLTVPYLTRVLGVERFGLIAFAQATVAYASILVDYGFSYSATREVAIHRGDKKRLRLIYSHVIWAKFGLALIGLAAIGIFLAAAPRFRSELLLFLACYTSVLASAFGSTWFFQGLEEMKYVTYAGLAARTVSTALVFILVRSRADYVVVPLLAGLGALVGGAYGQWIVWTRYKVFIGAPAFDGIWQQLRDGRDTFLTSAFVSLYTTTNVFLLGLLTNPIETGYYAAAEKVVYAMRSLWAPVAQVLYPHFSKMFLVDRERGKRQLHKVLVVTGIATLLLSLLGFAGADVIARHYLGAKFQQSGPIIRVLVFTVLAVGLNNILGVQGLLANGLARACRNIVLVSGVVNVLLLMVVARTFGGLGAAWCVTFIEFMIALAYALTLRRYNFL